MPARLPSARSIAWPRQMPTSSVVWWSSTCRSPVHETVRSISACRAKSSSMWSRKPDAGRDLGASLAVEVEHQADVGLAGLADDLGECGVNRSRQGIPDVEGRRTVRASPGRFGHAVPIIPKATRLVQPKPRRTSSRWSISASVPMLMRRPAGYPG